MMTLRPLSKIFVPPVVVPEVYTIELFDRTFSFHSLKNILAFADVSKAGDRNAKLATSNELERDAARGILSELTLDQIYLNPLTDNNGQIDNVMRVNYDIDLARFETIKTLTLGFVKDDLLRLRGPEIQEKYY